MVKICLPIQELRETQVQSLGQEYLLEKEMATTPIFLPGESHEQRSLMHYSPWGCKESDMAEVTEHIHPIHRGQYDARV